MTRQEPIRPKELVEAWVQAFNAGGSDVLAAMYSPGATNHQVAETPVQGATLSARSSGLVSKLQR